ncbi:hypothetical protein O181_112164 [Austropuccinia psidii MF-1]|uniref:Uncharacterized protein n=1 Tax=Austropuccinia psidii MF-1 TaxID=1389203 RepID=A0A9Q3PSH4_9BASI|nr:hypothetical protein [Austropuccinia psidii MF-1]
MENDRQGIKPKVPLERTCRKYPEDFPHRDILERTYHRREIEPERAYSDYFRLTRSGQPTKIPNGFTTLSIPDYWITDILNTEFKQNDSIRYTVDKDPYDWCLRQSKRLTAIETHITTEMRNHKLLTRLPGDLEHAVKCKFCKEYTFHEISTTLQEVRSRTSIGRYNTHSPGENRENPTLESKENHYLESEITTGFHNCESPNNYAENFPKDREEIF